LSTSAATASGEVADGADTARNQAALVVLAGVVTPQRLRKSVTGYRNVPNIRGFSVQSTPQKTLTELAAVGGFANRSLSVTTVRELKEAGQAAGVHIEVIPAPGHGFHSIVVTPRVLSTTVAQALSNVFHKMPNPSPGPQRRQ